MYQLLLLKDHVHCSRPINSTMYQTHSYLVMLPFIIKWLYQYLNPQSTIQPLSPLPGQRTSNILHSSQGGTNNWWHQYYFLFKTLHSEIITLIVNSSFYNQYKGIDSVIIVQGMREQNDFFLHLNAYLSIPDWTIINYL